MSVYKPTCFPVLDLRREEPQQQQEGHTVLRAAAAAAVEVPTVVSCANRDTNIWLRSTPKTTETGDTSRGRLSSDEKTPFTFYCFGPTEDALLAVCFICVSAFPSRRR